MKMTVTQFIDNFFKISGVMLVLATIVWLFHPDSTQIFTDLMSIYGFILINNLSMGYGVWSTRK